MNLNDSGTAGPFATTTSEDPNAELISGNDTRFWALYFRWFLLLPLAAVVLGLGVSHGRSQLTFLVLPLALPLVAVGWSASLMRSLREVRLSSMTLLVSDFSSQVEVPLNLVTDVREIPWMHVGSRHPIEVDFAPGAPLTRARFLPNGNPPFGWRAEDRQHPTMKRLLARVAQCHGEAPEKPFSS